MSLGDIGVSVPPHQTRTITQRKKSREARLSAGAAAPIPHAVVETLARNRRTLAFQARALLGLTEDLLKADTRAVAVDAALFADLRLPGDNPDDALRYLLRGLRTELRVLQDALAAPTGGGSESLPGLGPLRQHALAVAQVFQAVPETGAGHAVVSMIGTLLDLSGLMAWREFLSRFGGAEIANLPAASDSVAEETGAAPAPAQSAPEAAAQPAAAARPAAPQPAPQSVKRTAPVSAPAPRPQAQAAKPKPAAGTEDPLEIPLILVRPDHGDWARVLFKRGLAYLTKVYNEPPEKLRPLLGSWVEQSGDDHQKVFRLLAKAQTQREPDPKRWVTKILTESPSAPSAA